MYLFDWHICSQNAWVMLRQRKTFSSFLWHPCFSKASQAIKYFWSNHEMIFNLQIEKYDLGKTLPTHKLLHRLPDGKIHFRITFHYLWKRMITYFKSVPLPVFLIKVSFISVLICLTSPKIGGVLDSSVFSFDVQLSAELLSSSSSRIRWRWPMYEVASLKWNSKIQLP